FEQQVFCHVRPNPVAAAERKQSLAPGDTLAIIAVAEAEDFGDGQSAGNALQGKGPGAGSIHVRYRPEETVLVAFRHAAHDAGWARHAVENFRGIVWFRFVEHRLRPA